MKKFFDEFKAFAMRGNAVDMAVGVIIGGAFGKITTSLVNDIFMPLLGLLTGGVNFGGLFYALDGNKYTTIEAVLSPINAGAIAMIISIIIVPVVSLFTKAPEQKVVDEAFSCLEKKI